MAFFHDGELGDWAIGEQGAESGQGLGELSGFSGCPLQPHTAAVSSQTEGYHSTQQQQNLGFTEARLRDREQAGAAPCIVGLLSTWWSSRWRAQLAYQFI